MLELLTDADVHAPAPRGRCSLLIAGGKIAWIGPLRPELPGALDVRETSLGGRRLIPGLIDGHAHPTGGGGEAGPASRVPPLQLSQYTAAGITSVIGVLGTDDLVRTTAQLLTTVHGLAAEGLGAWCLTGGYHLPPATLTGSVKGDIVSLERVLGVGELALSDHRSSQPTLAELLRVASEAHVGGLMTGKAGVVHLHTGDGPRGLALVREALQTCELPPRVFHPTHVNRRKALFEEALELARRGCTIDVTAFPVEEGEDAWSATEAFEWYQGSGLPPERLTISSDAGGCLPTFDETGRVSGWGVARPAMLTGALQDLLAAGVAPAQALAPFTSNVADHWRLAGKGRIAVGADADLVTLDDRGAVHDVMAGGVWHRRGGVQRVRGAFE